jgi:predicted extracellular nuclease
LGDFNEFEFNLPLVNLLDIPLTNLAFTVPAGERYSYIFNGNSQALDHIFVSPAFEGSKLEFVHVNCEFADTSERASDHDPLVASIPMVRAGNYKRTNGEHDRRLRSNF